MSVTVTLRRTAVPSEKETKGRRGRKTASAADGRARYEIVATPSEDFGPPAYLDRELPAGGAEAYLAARKEGGRAFAMWSDPHRKQLWARVVTASTGPREPMRYEVHGQSGEFLGRITRERSFTGGHLRTRWSAEQAGGPAVVGYKGRCFWWAVWWLIFPPQCVLGVLALIGGGDLFRMPRRTGYRHRRGGERVLDFGRGMSDYWQLTAHTVGWDPRMLAALTALHCSHDGILGDSWDKGSAAQGEPVGAAASPVGA